MSVIEEPAPPATDDTAADVAVTAAAAGAAPADKKRRRMSELLRLIALVRPHRGRFALAVVALLLSSGLSLVYPQAARYGIDGGIAGGSLERLNFIVGGLLVLFALNGMFVFLRHYLMSWLGGRVVTDLRGMVFDRVLGLPVGWFHDQRTGELVGRLASDVTVIEGVVGSELSIALRNGVQLVGGLVLLLIVNWRLTLLMLGLVPPVILFTLVFGRRIRNMAKAVQDKLAEASGQVQESIGAIQTVQAFVRERREAAAYRRGVEGAFDEYLRLARWRAIFYAAVMLLGYGVIASIVWLGGRGVINDQLSSGELIQFLLYTAIVAGAFAEIAGLWGALQKAAGATERLFAIIDTVPLIRDPERPVDLPPVAPEGGGRIRFEHVEFAYPTRANHPVLRGLDLEVAPGEVIALVGPSGAGKSTIVSLLHRFYDVDRGAVRFEGVDLRALRLPELRRALAMVAQEPVLFSGTIRDNIAYARDDATPEQIERAARDAHAHEFVSTFPEGYDTLVGERGVKLSGGQKQRIAIARAILANPRVLILDEATSNLDAESESLVQEALVRLMKGRTTIVIAHRLSTVRNADRICVIDGGVISEQGTHEELMARAGTYRRLVERQVIASE